MRNESFAKLVAMLADDPALFHELISVGAGKTKRIAEMVPELAAAGSPPGSVAQRIALVLARTMVAGAGRDTGARLGDCVDSCEASRLAGQPAWAVAGHGAIRQAACGGDVTCCCTSGTCGGPTCGGSTCDVTCSGDSCGATCGDSCGMTSNFEMRLDSPAGWRGAAARAHVAGTANCGDCGVTCSDTCGTTNNVVTPIQSPKAALRAAGVLAGYANESCKPDVTCSAGTCADTICDIPSCAITCPDNTCGETLVAVGGRWSQPGQVFEPQAWRWR